jgi:hypothetical protein
MTSGISYLEELIRQTQKSEAEVKKLALEAGLRQLWREQVLGKYLREQITRDEAIEAVGLDLVELAERQHHAMQEDLEWGA